MLDPRGSFRSRGARRRARGRGPTRLHGVVLGRAAEDQPLRHQVGRGVARRSSRSPRPDTGAGRPPPNPEFKLKRLDAEPDDQAIMQYLPALREALARDRRRRRSAERRAGLVPPVVPVDLRDLPRRGALPAGVGRVPPPGGRERFFLYNNRSTDDHREVLAPRIEDGTVVVRDWPLFPGQRAAYEHCLAEHATTRAGSPSSTSTSSSSRPPAGRCRRCWPTTSSGPASASTGCGSAPPGTRRGRTAS